MTGTAASIPPQRRDRIPNPSWLFPHQMKEAAERALQAKNLPLDVAIECLTLRESRRAIDVVKDPVEDELHKEVEVIDGAKRDLQQKVSEAFEQLW